MSDKTDLLKSQERRKWPLAAAAVVLALLIGGAAFVGGRLLAPAGQVAGEPDLPPGMVFNASAGEEAQFFKLPDIIPAAELPDRAPDERGLFVQRHDDLLTIGTGNVMALISNESGGSPEFSYDGLEVEVLVTNRTALYEDMTEFAMGQESVQQVVRPLANLEDLSDSDTLQIWGQREGDRIVAETIVVLKPLSVSQP